MNSALRLGAGRAKRALNDHAAAILRPAVDIKVIPHLRQLGAAVVRRALTLGSLVVARTGAADVRFGAVLGAQRGFDVAERVSRGVGGCDVVFGEPVEGGQTAVVENDRFEEFDHFFVLGVLRAVAGDVERGEAGGVLGEFVLRKIM